MIYDISLTRDVKKLTATKKRRQKW